MTTPTKNQPKIIDNPKNQPKIDHKLQASHPPAGSAWITPWVAPRRTPAAFPRFGPGHQQRCAKRRERGERALGGAAGGGSVGERRP